MRKTLLIEDTKVVNLMDREGAGQNGAKHSLLGRRLRNPRGVSEKWAQDPFGLKITMV